METMWYVNKHIQTVMLKLSSAGSQGRKIVSKFQSTIYSICYQHFLECFYGAKWTLLCLQSCLSITESSIFWYMWHAFYVTLVRHSCWGHFLSFSNIPKRDYPHGRRREISCLLCNIRNSHWSPTFSSVLNECT